MIDLHQIRLVACSHLCAGALETEIVPESRLAKRGSGRLLKGWRRFRGRCDQGPKRSLASAGQLGSFLKAAATSCFFLFSSNMRSTNATMRSCGVLGGVLGIRTHRRVLPATFTADFGPELSVAAIYDGARLHAEVFCIAPSPRGNPPTPRARCSCAVSSRQRHQPPPKT